MKIRLKDDCTEKEDNEEECPFGKYDPAQFVGQAFKFTESIVSTLQNGRKAKISTE